MPGPKNCYQHFCPAARALEIVGEKWSLLIVRDLLGGPRRFSDLRRSLTAITPKWLSIRLQELEEAGVVAREAAGPREVWYRLTPRGQALAPLIEELFVWGVEHALRPPYPGEAVHPGRAIATFVTYLNHRGVRLPAPVTWVVQVTGRGSYTIRFDGQRWSRERGDGAGDVAVELSPDDWGNYLTATADERQRWLERAGAQGDPKRIAEFARTFGRQTPAPPHEATAAAAGSHGSTG
ncbi:MAG TPA: helix-turn-helix domain-containing protein [Dehalococcoidia bacterium]|jgi:DNA-binding HxlR family transcriptional regulator|nr:helix-turn-helix domain-containing protein [Dehalococcoidia bacterium]